MLRLLFLGAAAAAGSTTERAQPHCVESVYEHLFIYVYVICSVSLYASVLLCIHQALQLLLGAPQSERKRVEWREFNPGSPEIPAGGRVSVP